MVRRQGRVRVSVLPSPASTRHTTFPALVFRGIRSLHLSFYFALYLRARLSHGPASHLSHASARRTTALRNRRARLGLSAPAQPRSQDDTVPTSQPQ